jgi:hypothetical protein
MKLRLCHGLICMTEQIVDAYNEIRLVRNEYLRKGREGCIRTTLPKGQSI